MLTMINSRIIYGVVYAILEEYDVENGGIWETCQFLNSSQLILSYSKFGPTRANWLSVVMLEWENSPYWFAKFLILIQLLVNPPNKYDEVFALVHYFNVASPNDNVDSTLNWICHRWGINDGVDRTLSSIWQPAPFTTVEAGKWYCFILFVSVLSEHYIVTAKYHVTQFS